MKAQNKGHERVGILVDGSNVFITASRLGVKVDYQKILKRLNHRNIVRAILFHVEINHEREAGFLEKMKQIGFEVKTKRLKKFADGKAKADMDVDLVIDAIALSEFCDVITIVSGDGDFVPLLLYLRNRGIKTEVVSFPKNTSKVLRKVASRFIPITEEMLLSRGSVS